MRGEGCADSLESGVNTGGDELLFVVGIFGVNEWKEGNCLTAPLGGFGAENGVIN